MLVTFLFSVIEIIYLATGKCQIYYLDTSWTILLCIFQGILITHNIYNTAKKPCEQVIDYLGLGQLKWEQVEHGKDLVIKRQKKYVLFSTRRKMIGR